MAANQTGFSCCRYRPSIEPAATSSASTLDGVTSMPGARLIAGESSISLSACCTAAHACADGRLLAISVLACHSSRRRRTARRQISMRSAGSRRRCQGFARRRVRRWIRIESESDSRDLSTKRAASLWPAINLRLPRRQRRPHRPGQHRQGVLGWCPPNRLLNAWVFLRTQFVNSSRREASRISHRRKAGQFDPADLDHFLASNRTDNS
jgi:hypothetical protein